MKRYTIYKVDTPSTHCDKALTWGSIPSLEIMQFPWYQQGKKQQTHVKLCIDKDNLYIQITAQDKHSFAKQTELNHKLICEDSCAEFFFSPSGVLGSSYINLEVNCCGTLHIAYGPNRDKRQFISSELAKLVLCKSSIDSRDKLEAKEDETWVVDIKIPFDVIEKMTGENINTKKWLGNFYRCGGKTDRQYACWKPIEAKNPDFHQPKYFGELHFK